MITVRPGTERGQTQTYWLDSRHSFSFNMYFDPKHMGFQHLRVINEDWIRPGAGFGMHSHADMEILTYVIKGTLAHKDSTGGVGVIQAGEVQRMSAGTGISHSEFNHSDTEEVHMFQIWLLPERKGLTPGYEQRQFAAADRQDMLCLVAARDGRSQALTIYQDVDFYVASLTAPGKTVTHRLCPSRHGWLQVGLGSVKVNGIELKTGDAAAISDVEQVEIEALEPSEILFFDLVNNPKPNRH